MKTTKLALLLALIASSASAQQYVQGYTRADGTYVQGYYRSTPNNTRLDNYSTVGNVNPYTGQPGTRNPYPVQQPKLYYPNVAASYQQAFQAAQQQQLARQMAEQQMRLQQQQYEQQQRAQQAQTDPIYTPGYVPPQAGQH